MRKLNIKKIWFVVYMFLAIFEPPILPFSFIYVLGALTFFLILLRFGFVIPLKKWKVSKILDVFMVYLMAFVYILLIDIIDILFIEHADLISNRIRCINQLVVLSFIQFLAIFYIFLMAEDLELKLNDIFKYMFIVGAVQGVCSVAAYIVPTIRQIFIRFADSNLFSNAYFIERRGFGFSMTLIDTFGYGMGLLTGYLILKKWENRKIWRVIALILMVFSIAVNARTGFIIIAIALILKIMQGRNKVRQLAKILIAIPILYLFVYQILPILLEIGIQSTNVTVKWISVDMQELYLALLGGNPKTELAEASFFSNFGNLPQNAFEFLLGSGHSIYDTSSQLGFRTDVGYINLLWEFGLFGFIIIFAFLLFWMINPVKLVDEPDMRSIIVLNTVSYVIVLVKAILIGYNPGIFVTYLSTSAIYYYSSVKKKKTARVFR